LGLMDVCEVCARWFTNHTSFRMSHSVSDPEQEEDTVKDSIYTPENTTNAPFAIEKIRESVSSYRLKGRACGIRTSIRLSSKRR
jgi:hypothetical protein